MPGHRERRGALFSYVLMRSAARQAIRCGDPRLVDHALDRLNPIFCEQSAAEGRASVLHAFYASCSEQLLWEH